jgi:glucose-1-phosphate cytidylyltransferase
MSDVTFDLQNHRSQIHRSNVEPWRVTLVDTGERTMTGGRIKRVRKHVDGEAFCLTYGDAVSDINIRELVAHHKRLGVRATLTAVRPPGRFGAFNLALGQETIESFKEKPQGGNAYINGGFVVLEPQVMDYIDGDATVWEREPMERLAHDRQLGAYRHHGFWQPMDTLRDKMMLEELWQNGKAPWKTW